MSDIQCNGRWCLNSKTKQAITAQLTTLSNLSAPDIDLRPSSPYAVWSWSAGAVQQYIFVVTVMAAGIASKLDLVDGHHIHKGPSEQHTDSSSCSMHSLT